MRAFAAAGRESVLPEWASAYFKWWGIYTQGDGAGVLGGKGGEGKATEYFMMRIALPNGIATSEQIELIADIAAKHGETWLTSPCARPSNSIGSRLKRCPEIIERLDQAPDLSPKRSLRRCGAQCHRLPTGGSGRRRSSGCLTLSLWPPPGT